MEWLPDPGNHRPVREGILRKRVSCTQKMNLVSFYYSSAAHAAADTQSSQTLFRILSFHLMQQSNQNTAARCTYRMTQCVLKQQSNMS